MVFPIASTLNSGGEEIDRQTYIHIVSQAGKISFRESFKSLISFLPFMTSFFIWFYSFLSQCKFTLFVSPACRYNYCFFYKVHTSPLLYFRYESGIYGQLFLCYITHQDDLGLVSHLSSCHCFLPSVYCVAFRFWPLFNKHVWNLTGDDHCWHLAVVSV